MLQRQVMLKQLQELERKQQQFLESVDGRNQLASLKQDSSDQFSPPGNGIHVFDSSHPLMVGNVQMTQHSGLSSFQGFPNKSVHSQSRDQSASLRGISHLQYDMSLYGAPHLQGLSTNPLFKVDNSSYGLPSLNESILNQHCNQPFDENVPDGSFQSSHLFQGKNIFEQSGVQNFDPGILPENYREYENTNTGLAFTVESEVSHEDVSWNGHSTKPISELGLSSLDPLEQKILYDTDDSLWESSVSHGSNMCTTRGLFVDNASYVDELPSIQSGSWSALMQSAVAETSSSDTGIQEEWSGLSFQNPEPSADYQLTNFCENDKQQNNWIDKNMQYQSSPCSNTESYIHSSDKICNFPSLPQLGIQHLKQPGDFNSESSIASNQQRGAIQVIPTSFPSSISWPAQENDHLKNDEHHQTDNFPRINDNQTNDHLSGQNVQGSPWHHDKSIYPVAGDQKPFSKVNRLTTRGYLSESEKLDPGNNVEPMPSMLSASEHLQSVSNRSGNKDDLLNDHTPEDQLMSEISTLNELPQSEVLLPAFAEPSPTMHSLSFRPGSTNPRNSLSYSVFPALSMGNSSGSTFSSQYVSDHTKSQYPTPPVPIHVASEFPSYHGCPDFHGKIISDSLPSEISVVPEQMGTAMKVPSSWPDMTPQQKITFCQSIQMTSNLLQSTDSASSSLETNMGPQNNLLNQKLNKQGCEEGSMRNHFFEPDDALDPQKSDQYHREKKILDDPSKDERTVGQLLAQNHLLEHRNQSGMSYDQKNHEAAHVSQISLQMAPSWFKQYGDLKNEQMLSTFDTNNEFNKAKQISAMPHQNLQENSLYRQADSINPSHGSCVWPSLTTTLLERQLSNPSMHHSLQNLDASLPKKRKLFPFNMVPWHKELNLGQSSRQNISESGIAEIEWAQASNSRAQFKNEAEIFEDVFPKVRVKRRLVFTTQMMQELFRSMPRAFLNEDARSVCDCIIYSAARLALGDACCLTGHLPSENKIISPESSQILEGATALESSKAVKCLISRVNKLEESISRMGRSLLIADVKVENQELEKVSIINHFAKFYIKAQPNTTDTTASSSVSGTQKINVQRYVMAIPMPKTLPEGTDCLSL